VSILGDMFAAFASYGPAWMLVGLFVVVFFDAIVVPVGPELLAIAIYSTNLDLAWALLIIATVTTAQVSGTSVLYLIGKHPRLLPKRIRDVMLQYRSFLVIKDERIIFVNCFVPILPFLGAFIAISNWDYKKSMLLVALGGAIKYSLFLSMSRTFHYLFAQGIAQKVSLLTVLGVLVASGLYAFYRRRAFQRSKRDEAGTARDKNIQRGEGEGVDETGEPGKRRGPAHG
jgi:membrane protein YqaA with SNARE-associated domain